MMAVGINRRMALFEEVLTEVVRGEISRYL
jgi:hypothetical protein